MLILDVQKVDKTMDTPQVMEDVLIDQHNVEVHQSEEPVKGRFAIIKRAIYNKLVSAWLVVAAIFSQSNVHKELKNEKEVECASLVVKTQTKQPTIIMLLKSRLLTSIHMQIRRHTRVATHEALDTTVLSKDARMFTHLFKCGTIYR